MKITIYVKNLSVSELKTSLEVLEKLRRGIWAAETDNFVIEYSGESKI